MARHKRKRKVAALPKVTVLTANYPVANGREEAMTVEEYETVRLIDHVHKAVQRSAWELPERQSKQFTTTRARRWQDCLLKAEH